jgi:hypothetical protein
MSSIVSKLADEIQLHGSYEAYCAWRDQDGSGPLHPDLPKPLQLRLEWDVAVQLPWRDRPGDIPDPG